MVTLQARTVSSDLFILWQAEKHPCEISPEPINVILYDTRDLVDNHWRILRWDYLGYPGRPYVIISVLMKGS